MDSQQGNKLYIFGITLVATIGGLLFGYDTAVISGAVDSLKVHFHLNADTFGELATFYHGATVSSALLGCVIGGAISGLLASGLGRKKALVIAALLFLFSSLGASNPEFMISTHGDGSFPILIMIGNFQDGSVAGKIQFGAGWWFLDQKFGMTAQMNSLSVLGLLSRFVGMLTDSRSFLSYPRHEYFRRIMCNLIGVDVVNGEIPESELPFLEKMVEGVSYYNAKEFFKF